MERRLVMEPFMRVYLLDENHKKYFGEGPCRLLHAIEKTGSLRGAAKQMDMAYTKALAILKQAETTLGYPLTTRNIGGKGGGGSSLTPEAKEFLEKYEAYRDACYEAGNRIYHQIFSEQS